MNKVFRVVSVGVFILTVFWIYGQEAPTQEWVARYDGPVISFNRDEANAIAVDLEGNVYVTGVSYRSTTGGDYATVAYDTHGNQLWDATYNNLDTANVDWAKDIAVGPSGNVYVTGYSYDSDNGYDYATVAYDPSGSQLWVARYDGNGSPQVHHDWDEAYAVAVGPTGIVYVTGRSMGDNGNVSNTKNYDIATVAYDHNGNQIWEARYNGSYNICDWGIAIATDHSGNVYVTGTINWVGTFAGDWITIAYDSSGNQLWYQIYEGYMGLSARPLDMVVDSTGNVYVTGFTTNRSSPTWGYMYVTIAYDSSGTRKWIAEYDQGNDGFGQAVALDSMGNVYVSGYCANDYVTIAYDPNGNQLWEAKYPNGGYTPANVYQRDCTIAVDSSGIVYVSGGTYVGGSNGDYVTIAYDTNGNQIWEATYNGPGNDYDRSVEIAIDPADNVYVTGFSAGDGTGNDYATIKYGRSLTVSVDIDIKPGSDPNSINLGDHGLLPVAILGIMEFDVTNVDPVTIEIGGVALASRGSAKAPKLAFSYEDVNSDGYLDIISFFEVQTLVSEGILTESTIALTITATLYDGTSIEGTDSVNVVH